MFTSTLAITAVAVAAGALALGLTVAVRERWRAAARELAGLCLLVATWLGCVGLMLRAANELAAEPWARASYLGVALIPPALYQLSARLLRRHREQRMAIAAAWTVGLVLAALAQGSDLVVDGVRRHAWGYYTHLAPAGALVVALYLAVLIAVFALFAAELAGGHPGRRQRPAAYGAAFAVGALAMVDFLPAFGWPVPPLGLLPIAAGVALTARAVWRHRLLETAPALAGDRILEALLGAVLVCDLEERIRVANPAACTLLGYPPEELLALRLADVIETPRNFGNSSDTLMRGGLVRDRPMIWRRRDRSRVEVEVSVSMVRDDLGAPAGMVFVAGGIADRERAARVDYQAFHDPLTGLPNRTSFSERLEARLAGAALRGTRLAVLFLDLDGFKVINDSLGHGAGDRVLQLLSRRLRDAVREGDLVSRFGGDEFTVLLEISRLEDAEAVAQKLLAAVAEPFVVAGERLYLTASVGVALHPEHGSDPEVLLRNADAAMYLAKELGRNNYQLFGQGLSERARQRLWIEAELRATLAGEGFALHYQPILELASDRVTGAEALLRWPRGGELLLPDQFLPLAEQTQLIRPLGEWILRTAVDQAVRWQDRFGSLRLAVNLSGHQLTSPGFVDQVESLLAGSGLPPQRLELEITESVAMKDPERTRELLGRLKSLGVRLALDDFGTGYSSLAYLQQFPLDTVKIDRGFVANMGRTRGGLAIIRATLAMATALGLRVTAEGVESQLQLDLLRDLGCHCAQGFGIGRPVPPADFEAVVQQGGQRHDSGGRPIFILRPDPER